MRRDARDGAQAAATDARHPRRRRRRASGTAEERALRLSARTEQVSRLIAAPPEKIFDILSDASKHALIDGSGTVRAAAAQRLELGSRFGTAMRIGLVPYRVRNRIVEFERNRRIAWSNVNRAVWRYELEPADGGTRVTEIYEWGRSPFWPLLSAGGWTTRMRGAMERTLERLERLVAV